MTCLHVLSSECVWCVWCSSASFFLQGYLQCVRGEACAYVSYCRTQSKRNQLCIYVKNWKDEEDSKIKALSQAISMTFYFPGQLNKTKQRRNKNFTINSMYIFFTKLYIKSFILTDDAHLTDTKRLFLGSWC